MPITNLYHIISFEYQNGSGMINSRIGLNSDHTLFSGHFPGNPILPGVCTVQIARELISKALDREYRLSKAANIKYLGFVNPVASPELIFQVLISATGQNLFNCNVTVKAGDHLVCSFKGEYIQI